jgi:hypothetical protein
MHKQLPLPIWARAAVLGFGVGVIAMIAWYFIAPDDISGDASTLHVPRGTDLTLDIPLLIWLTPPVFALCAGLAGWAIIRVTATTSRTTRSELLSIAAVGGCTLAGAAILFTVWVVPHDAKLIEGDTGHLPNVGFAWAFLFPIAGFALGVMLAGTIRHPDEDNADE